MHPRKFHLKMFQYYWSTSDRHGFIMATSLTTAKIALKTQGITPQKLHRKITLPQWKKTLSTREIAAFFRQIATLLTAGIPIVQACEILSHSQTQSELLNLSHFLKSELEAGKSLSTSIEHHPHYFDKLTCHLIYIGEQTGTLDCMLARIANYKEKAQALKSQIRQAITYPIIVLCVASIIITTMLVWVIPRFAELFQDFHGKLPYLTTQVIRFSDTLRQHGWLALLLLPGMKIFHYYFQHSLNFRFYLDKNIFRLPFLGDLVQKFLLARFTRSLTILITAGITLTDALSMTININNNHWFCMMIRQLHSEVATGQRLYLTMSSKPLFPPLVVQMIKVGEESGCLDQMLEKIADFYEADIDHYARHFNQLLEPLIILVLGVLIGGLVIAMYLPIFKLGTLF